MPDNTPIIARTAMLAGLHISQWSARRYDKTASHELNSSKHAKDVARVNKLLVSGSAIKPIQQLAGEIRQEFYRRTLPWGDNGDRVLPALDYQDWMDWYNAKRDEWYDHVNHFVDTTYRDEVRDAAYRMGDLFDITDYPSPSEVKHKFHMHFSVSPVPTGDDFRVSLSEDVDAMLREQVTADIERLTAHTVAHLWAQLGEMMQAIRDRLSDPDARFRRGLLDNFVEMIDDLDKLNVAADPALDKLRDQAMTTVTALRDPDALRKDKSARQAAADEVGSLVDQFSGMWG